MRRVLTFGLCLWLAGCGFTAQVIKTDSLAYSDIIEDTTNKLLAFNVLCLNP